MTLAAGQLGRIGLRPVLQADDLKQFHHPLVRLPAGQSRNFKGVAHIFSDGALHQEVELLKDHAHLPAELEQIRPAHLEDILPAVEHFAARGHIKPVDAADQCRLSRPAHADDAIDFALSHIQADSVERYDLTLRRAVYLGQFPYLDQRLFYHIIPSHLCIKKPASHLREAGLRSNGNDQAARRNKRGVKLRIIIDIPMAFSFMMASLLPCASA